MDFFQQVNLTINHNWQSTKKVVENLIKLEQHVVPSEYGAADHYELKSLGTISRHRPSEHWYRVSGPAVTRTMSWLPKMLDIMKELKLLDHVAYVRFASVYRSFQDVSEFTDMIEDLQKK